MFPKNNQGTRDSTFWWQVEFTDICAYPILEMMHD